MSSIWAKRCMLIIVFVLSDLTWLPLLGGGRKSWYIIILLFVCIVFAGYGRSSTYGHKYLNTDGV